MITRRVRSRRHADPYALDAAVLVGFRDAAQITTTRHLPGRPA
jgi:hypothetical protein